MPSVAYILPQKLCAHYLEWLLLPPQSLHLLNKLLRVRVVLHVATNQKCAQVVV